MDQICVSKSFCLPTFRVIPPNTAKLGQILLSAANWHGETRVEAGLAGRFELNGCNHARFPTSLAWG